MSEHAFFGDEPGNAVPPAPRAWERELEQTKEPAAFVRLREFLELEFPPSEALVGSAERGGTNLLPRFGWAMLWGAEGSGKTSVALDLLVHAAAGRAWLGYPTLRPCRFVAVVNEGVPGGLQDRLAEKIETWDGDEGDAILDRIALYTSPWGEFSLQSKPMRERLRSFARDFGADYVSLDPLHTVGTFGIGGPSDTEQFKHLLRELGLWDELGFLAMHHNNKAGMLSGDWGRHPDTLIRLEKDGARPASKFTVQKARPCDPAELNVVQVLEWEAETLGFRRVQAEAQSPQAVGAGNREAVLEAATEGLRSIEEIAARVDLSDRTVSGHLKRLEQDGALTLERGARGKVAVASLGNEPRAEE